MYKILVKLQNGKNFISGEIYKTKEEAEKHRLNFIKVFNLKESQVEIIELYTRDNEDENA